MSLFSSPPKKSIVYPNPSDNSRPLFFILGSVHILKCIRNNWQNQKTDNSVSYILVLIFTTWTWPNQIPLDYRMLLWKL